jgi:hypothetical protein
MALDQLYGQTRLSYAATADDYELILAEKLQQGSERAAEGRGLGRRTFDAIVYMEDGPAWAPGVKGRLETRKPSSAAAERGGAERRGRKRGGDGRGQVHSWVSREGGGRLGGLLFEGAIGAGDGEQTERDSGATTA